MNHVPCLLLTHSLYHNTPLAPDICDTIVSYSGESIRFLNKDSEENCEVRLLWDNQYLYLELSCSPQAASFLNGLRRKSKRSAQQMEIPQICGAFQILGSQHIFDIIRNSRNEKERRLLILLEHPSRPGEHEYALPVGYVLTETCICLSVRMLRRGFRNCHDPACRQRDCSTGSFIAYGVLRAVCAFGTCMLCGYFNSLCYFYGKEVANTYADVQERDLWPETFHPLGFAQVCSNCSKKHKLVVSGSGDLPDPHRRANQVILFQACAFPYGRPPWDENTESPMHVVKAFSLLGIDCSEL